LASKSGSTLTNTTLSSPTINSPVINNSVTINNVSQSYGVFTCPITCNYTGSVSLHMFPNYLGSYFSAGNVYTLYGLSSYLSSGNVAGIIMSNFYVGLSWACPTYDISVSDDAFMNCCFVEISYWIQESPVNTGTTNYTNYSVSYSPNTYTNSQSTTYNSTTNSNVGNLFCSGTAIFYIANSISTNTSSNIYIKYISGSFSGGGGSLLSSTNRYGSTFTPVQFTRLSYNRIIINFNFPSSNNTSTTNTYGTGQYISSYGCSARIIGSDNGNIAGVGNIYPSNASTQSFKSFSNSGRAYFSL
jgi:hypothetical protein